MGDPENARAFTTAVSVIKGSMAIDASSPNIPVYKLKRIDFFGRTVPIALQNENGPCPLLAIANVLLLRKQIELPEQAPDVSQVWYAWVAHNFCVTALTSQQTL